GCPADARRRSSQGIFDMSTVRIHRRSGTGAAGIVI
ncbi:diguanylate cyclase, partial [Shigella flexneri]|nr:diguanylate cyclase [Shigella flexneri]